MSCNWCILCGLLCFFIPTPTAGRTSSPKILVADGNLIIQSGKNRNISFNVGKSSDILFGDTSLKTLEKSVKKHNKEISLLKQGITIACPSDNPCTAHGVCISAGNREGYKCICNIGYTGIHCERKAKVDPCLFNPCENNGKCNTTNGVTHCICQGDWFGRHCTAQKPKECKFELKHKVGIISSPGYPHAYPPNTECKWTIKAPAMRIIEVFVTVVSIGTTTSCGESGYLQVTDNTYLNRKLCGDISTQELIASNELTLTFKSGPEIPVGIGFSLLFSQQINRICGGHLTAVAGIIESPEHHKAVVCGWVIDNKSSEHLQLKFDVMNIINDQGSCKNYLEIHAGPDSASPSVRKLCHYNGALSLNLQSSTAFIKFVSNSTASRFHGSYDIICGGATFLPSGTYEIKSPFYPKPYPSKKLCTWNLKAVAAATLAVRFLEFDVEPHPTCSYDTLALYDGKSRSAPLLASYCGNRTPLPVITSDQNLMVSFQTDGDGDFRGFRAIVRVVKHGCGGIFNGKNGLIHTPPIGSSGACFYTVSSDKPAHAIQLFFSKFLLRSSNNCEDEYIQIFEGQVANGNPQKYCGSNKPPVTTSEKRSVTVKFFSRNVTINTEFFGRWKSIAKPAGCDLVLSGTTGSIQSVNYPSNYNPNMDCKYSINTETGHLIKLVFNVFSLEHHVTCINDYLAIYDGENAEAPLIGTFCGTRSPKMIVSSSNKLFLHFKTDLSGEDKGFHAQYITGTNLCGGFLHQDSGFINSPNYPSLYHPNQECVWYIQSGEGNFIDLTIIDFSLEAQPTCSLNDYVHIYDGDNRGSTLVAELCGDKEPKTHFRSSSHYLTIEFKSDSYLQKKGFKFYFKSGCGGVFDARNGVISTPNYPRNYPLARTCNWVINSHVNDIINIKSVDFKLQPSPSCEFDYLQIHSGKNIQKFCGSIGPSHNFTSDKVYLTFKSGTRISNKGFQLNYTIIGCSGDLWTPNGSFSTPNYPKNYPALSYCKWRIIVQPGKRIKLRIPSIQVGGGECRNNSVIAYNGGNVKSPMLQTYCNHRQQIILTSSSNKLTILFTSTVADVGFTATYESIAGGCGGLVRSTSGYIHSPNYPNVYPKRRECTWNLNIPTTGGVKLTFKSFDIEYSTNCSYDYLKIVDRKTSQVIGKFCGSSIPLPQASTSNRMDLVFVSDNLGSNKGFKAYYQPGCGGTILIDSVESIGYISTPGFPRNYSEDVCVWHLKAKSGNKVVLKFEAFSLEAGTNGVCAGDYVQIHNGDSTAAPLLKKYCGQAIPAAVISTGSSLYVKFFANKVYDFSGFKAVYSSVFTGCGGSLRYYKGSFANSLYPEKTTTFQYCTFTIQVAAGNRISLNFEVFDLVGNVLCIGNYLKVSEGSIPKLKICGNDQQADFKSTSNSIKVLYSSTGLTGTRFKINYRTECSGVSLQQNRGTVQSPNYPNPYPHNSNCFWRVQAPENINVIIEFQTFNLEDQVNRVCRDYVQIYDGFYNLMATYCGSSIPPPLRSAGRLLLIRFVSDRSVSFGGFSMKYRYTIDPSSACGGMYTATTLPGYISTPNYPLNYPPDQFCEYQIDATPGTSIKLTFLAFDIEAYYCYYDRVTVYDGNKLRKIATLCSKMGVNKVYHSTGTRMIVTFYSDDTGQYNGFKAKFERVCGGILTATKGIIKSPTVNGKYGVFENCTWIVQQSPGTVIKLHFTSFDLENSTDCTTDYLIVRNGLSADSPIVGRYCGSNIPANYTSTGAALFFQFVSDNATGAGGFEAIYERFIHGCGGTESLTDHTLTYELTSPGYPNTYPINIDCEWILRVPVGFVVDFSIVEFTSNFTCSTDYLILRSGRSTKSPLIGSFCGSALPHQKHYKSSGNGMYVQLFAGTKPSNSRSFFKATWKIGCGGWHMAESGSIVSPLYPSQYPPNSNCTYHIKVLGKKQLHLQFNTFSLFTNGTGTNCSEQGDYIEIFDADHNKTKIGRYCGSKLPEPIVALTDALIINFISNGVSSSNGFQARFSTVGQVCGGFMYRTGTFKTPFYPRQYPLHRECIWVLQSTPGISVQLKFEKFDLESSVNCTGDRVVIRNGRYYHGGYYGGSALSPVIGTYCGTSLPAVIHSSGNFLSVIFISDRSTDRGTGFKASFKSALIGCGGDVFGKQGEITSPGYPIKYDNNIECEWKITVPKQYAVKITLDDLNLEPKLYGYCYDYLRIKDGSTVVAKMCGRRIQYTYTTFGSTVNILFHSDSLDTYPGFKLKWKAVIPQCTDVVIPIKTGEITNPGYPGYADNLDCTWRWVEQVGETITLHLLDIDLLYSENCTIDSVTIQNGHEKTSPIIATLCGNMNDSMNRFIQSSGQYMRLTFKTGSDVNRTANSTANRGFRIGFTTRKEGCGGLLISNSGNFTSPNYPNTYPNYASCTWVIQTEVGSKVYVYIQDLDIEDHHTCAYDALQLRDGDSINSPLITHLCGNDHHQYSSSSNYMFIQFKTDMYGGGRGFKIHYNTGCGGILKGKSGYAHSPNYPNPYPPNQDCRWSIDLAKEYHVKLTELDFNLPPHNMAECVGDYVQLRDGLNISSVLLATFCGNMSNQQYQSQYHQLFVQFVSDNVTNTIYKGVKAHYTAVCGETLREPGMLKYPTVGNYAKNESCVWLIQFPVGEKVVVITRSFVVEALSNFLCVYDYLEIRDGNDENAPLFGRFCGTAKPPVFQSTTNYVYIKFVSDVSIQRMGFEIQYSKSIPEGTCGGLMTASSGNITSPGYPSVFPMNLDCGWRIVQPAGTRINVTFTYFQLTKPSQIYGDYRDCRNYIKLFENDYPDDTQRRHSITCGNITGFGFQSLGNTLYISFHSSAKVAPGGDGFYINYITHTSGCGGAVKLSIGETKFLTSPGYPENITVGATCQWLLKAPVGYQLKATLDEINFPRLTNGSCPWTSRLMLYDGLLGVVLPLCGVDMKGKTLQSSIHATRLVLIRGSVGNPFKIRLETTKGCNQTFTASSGMVSSPNFPYSYLHAAKCHYYITAPEGHVITIFPISFNIELHPMCRYDYLEINDGADSNAPKFGNRNYCGIESPPTLSSSGNKMHLLFTTDANVATAGFAFTYTMSSGACGGNITGYLGSITSPKYPELYNGAYECEWDITVSSGKKVNVTLAHFELEQPAQNADCTTVDYLEVLDDTTSYGKYCGLTHFHELTTNSNKVKVKFVSNNVNNAYRGFQLYYIQTL